jgi:hypothetical protein
MNPIKRGKVEIFGKTIIKLRVVTLGEWWLPLNSEYFIFSSPSENVQIKIVKNSVLSSASELYRPSNRRLSMKLVPTLADTECRVVSATNLHGR